MSRARRCLAMFGGLLAVGASPPPAQGLVPGRFDQDTVATLRTVAGVRIIERINRRNDLVAARLYLLGGTRQLTERTAGIEALFLNAATAGTAHFPGRESQRALARTGAVEVLEPDADWTVTGLIVLREDFDSAWAVFADRLTHPTLDSEEVRKARDLMLTTVRRRFSDPDERIQVIANQAAFTGHPYALDPEGTEKSLGAITDRDLAEYARSQLVTSRMLLVVVGNVDTAEVSALVTRTIGTLPHGDYRWTLPPPLPHLNHSHWLVESRNLATNYILGYFTGPPVSSSDYAPFRVAVSLLSSELENAIRVRNSLSYATYAPFLERAEAVGGVYASTATPEKVLPLMYQQIQGMVDVAYDELSLHEFITGFRVKYLFDNATDDGQADGLARAELYLGDYRQIDRFRQQLFRVGRYDVLRVASRYMRIINWAYLGDTVRMEGHW